jgi:cold shock CspA family protein
MEVDTQPQVEAAPAVVQDANSGNKSTGSVKWFNVTKGYGFITPDGGGEDLFVHQSAIVCDGFRSLREGEVVEFVVETSPDGRAKAVQVTGPGGAAPEGAPRRRPMNNGYGGGMYRNGGGYGGNYGAGGFGFGPPRGGYMQAPQGFQGPPPGGYANPSGEFPGGGPPGGFY